MLVLSRKPNESVVIGDDIRITVVEVTKHRKVRLGIEAPREVPVYRSELIEPPKETAKGETNARA